MMHSTLVPVHPLHNHGMRVWRSFPDFPADREWGGGSAVLQPQQVQARVTG